MNFDLLAGKIPEIIAVALAILYLVLAVKQNIGCWIAWILSSVLYLFIMYKAGLYMEASLQIFYIVMGFYGWSQWLKSTPQEKFVVKTWNWKKHLTAIAFVLLLTLSSGWALEIYTTASLPFLDAFTTWGAIITTYMVAKKILENWIYWFVIDSISIYLFLSRDLYFTACLFLIYLFIIVLGYRSWNKIKQSENT
tara:strand:+ start:79 stop:663 length:585 start_codon:yes stop_codon:yes gene_type:complete